MAADRQRVSIGYRVLSGRQTKAVVSGYRFPPPKTLCEAGVLMPANAQWCGFDSASYKDVVHRYKRCPEVSVLHSHHHRGELGRRGH